ncbi:MAG: metal-dependent transcriptional regulator [Lachnospiraceae bacterium]|jgi:Mn-dependent DtxR family transcriptional regulator|uniref:metal-dependent transcriptional regulator n=1 Tax=Candidatus Merdisoma sp. JLR.KK006 TaxID=3112626 RepID=UPI002FEFF5C1|nr:metal-dependent transcriptional regulator [Lachnospiraceae bacterium]
MSYQKHKSEESVEDYLETILILNGKLANVRSIDIANELNYSKPSVSVAMKNLRQRNYITVSEDGYIRLTDEGQKLAETVYERHSILSEWLIQIGVTPEIAIADACRMEHDISAESFDAIKKYLLKNPS